MPGTVPKLTSSWNRQYFGKRDPRQIINFLQTSDESLTNGKALHYTCVPVFTVSDNVTLCSPFLFLFSFAPLLESFIL